MLDFEHFENLVQSIGKYSFAEELVDIVNADLTFTLFFFLGVMTGYKQIFGDPIHCMPPAAYTKWEDYYNSYCYIQSKIIIQSMHPHSFNRNIKTDPDLEQLVYYQWVPYVFMLMAILFRVPRMFWTTFARFFCYGEDIGSFIEDCNTIKEKTKPKERAKAISKLAEFICRTMNMRSRRSLFGQSMAVFCVLRKLLAVIIVLSQFLLLCYLIPSRFNLLWGFELLTYKWMTMEHSLEGIEGVFPTLVRCDVSQMDANYVMFKLKMPCVLMQNFIIEKMFAFVYFWLLVILVVNVGSLLKKMMILVWPQHRYRMANQHLSNRERLSDAYKEATGVGANSAQLEWQRRQFIDKALSADGILMFNFLRARVGSFLAQDLIVELWKAYAKPAFQTADCVSEQSIVSVRITDKRNSDADAATEEETTRLVAYTLNDRITLFDVAPSAPPTEE